jgi:hypothetical protein
MNPHDIVMEDISNVFYDTITSVKNMRTFKAQESVLEHEHDESNKQNIAH